MPHFRRSLTPLGLAVVLALGASAPLAHASWPNDPTQPGVIVGEGPGTQWPAGAAPDGAGGCVIVWADNRSGGYDIYAQRLDANGEPQWATNGVLVATSAVEDYEPRIVSDGAGGVIVAWQSITTPIAHFAQRLNANGTRLWGSGGVRIANQPKDQWYLVMAPDGAGGALFAWIYAFSQTDRDVYAQRLSAAGAQQWLAGGVPVCTTIDDQDVAAVAADGAGGLWVLWRDDRGTVEDVYHQHLNAAGAPLLTVGGVLSENMAPGLIEGLTAIADGHGGAIATFALNASNNYDVMAIRILPSGSVWTAVLSAASGDQLTPRLAADPSGGAFVFWSDYRADADGDIYGTYLTGTGLVSTAWPQHGLAVATGVGVIQSGHSVAPDGEGGAIVAWNEGSIYGRHIVAKRLRPNGTMPPGWLTSGNPISTRPFVSTNVVTVPIAPGWVVTAWGVLYGSNYDGLAQRIDRFGTIGEPEPRIAGVTDVPNDQGGRVRVSWNASPLDAGMDPRVNGYQLWREIPTAAALAALRAGRARLLEGDVPDAGDVGVARLRAHRAGAHTSYWEYVAGVAAQRFAGYSIVAATTADSVPGSNPHTRFLVEALGNFVAPGPVSATTFWWSDPDSGYSVDNLAPATPTGFAGSWSYGAGADLHWNANGEADLAGYHVYRAHAPGFVPSPANRVATIQQTSFDDSGAPASYYRLTAYDVHGNESPSVLLTPAGTTDAPDARPLALALAIASEHPGRGRVALRMDLPAPARVDLAIHDLGGRRVRTLAAGERAAGSWPVVWRGERDDGGRAAAGVYFVRLVSDAGVLARRIVIVD